MRNYFTEIQKILEEHSGNIDSLTIINKDGIIEYTETFNHSLTDTDLSSFQKSITGKHVLEAYFGITEETSTVLYTLRTGQPVHLERQILETPSVTMTISANTYPIFDDAGQIQGAIDATKLIEYHDIGSKDNSSLYVLNDIITQNLEMIKIKNIIQEVAKTDSSVFISGETGTGKELVAEALHMLSSRSHKPFISQNCAAIPENLMESIFFGTEKGGFTGAEVKKGLFELADGGTLFLDEINSMDTPMQAKLLKALEEQEVRKIGGEKPISFNVRIICASNEPPAELLRSKKMRSDFYYRISVVKIDLPPLRQRPEDIPLLTDYFIKRYNKQMHKNIEGLSKMASDLFQKWTWPGNVRELKTTIESAFNLETSRMITLSSVRDLLLRISETNDIPPSASSSEGAAGPVSETDMQRAIATEAGSNAPQPFSLPKIKSLLESGTISLQDLLETYERAIICETIRSDKKLNLAAEHLNMSPQKLNYRIKKLNINKQYL